MLLLTVALKLVPFMTAMVGNDKEIHTTDHGNPKHHSYGSHGEHIHYYEWDRETGKRISSTQEEIPEDLRKENDDIL